MHNSFSIITVVKNNSAGLALTLESIFSQKYPHVQSIIIDGKSEDDTLLECKKFPQIAMCISEEDSGIYNAMNKGLQHATATWTLFLNAEDRLYDSITLQNLNSFIARNPSADIICGDTIENFFGQEIIRPSKPTNELPLHMPACHQSLLIKTALLKTHEFDESYKICADLEQLAYFINHAATPAYYPNIISRVNGIGESNISWKIAMQERTRVQQHYYSDKKTERALKKHHRLVRAKHLFRLCMPLFLQKVFRFLLHKTPSKTVTKSIYKPSPQATHTHSKNQAPIQIPTNKKHLLWLTTIFDDSAVSNILLQIIPYLTKYNITVISLGTAHADSSHALRQLAQFNIKHINLHTSSTQIYQAQKKLAHYIDTLNADIVHAQLGRAYIALLLCKPAQKKFYRIATFHNNADYFNMLTYTLLKLFFRRFDAISAVSHTALQTIQKSFNKKNSVPSYTIYNPIAILENKQHKVTHAPLDSTLPPNCATTTIDSNTHQTILNSPLIILSVGRLVKRKGHELWIQMLPELEALGVDFQLWCAGSGPLKAHIINKCKKQVLQKQLIMLGYRQDVHTLMQKANIVIFPSQNEGFGLVPCEALLMGTPIVAHNLGVMQELLEDDTWLIDCKDKRAFAQKIFEICTQKDKYKARINIAQTRLSKTCSPEHIASQYRNFYDRLLDRPL